MKHKQRLLSVALLCLALSSALAQPSPSASSIQINETCPKPHWPETTPCSSHGLCISASPSSTCQCDEGYSGLTDGLNFGALDCPLHIKSRLAFIIITLILLIINFIGPCDPNLSTISESSSCSGNQPLSPFSNAPHPPHLIILIL